MSLKILLEFDIFYFILFLLSLHVVPLILIFQVDVVFVFKENVFSFKIITRL